MQIHRIISGFHAEPAPAICMILQIEATIDSHVGKETFTFTYRPEDPYGLNPEITAWLMSHPEFEPEPYDPNREF